MNQNRNPDLLKLEPVGYLRSPAEKKYQLPPQPHDSPKIEGVIELLPGHNYEVALRDLDGFSRIWLVWWFHKNENWRPTTLPPRGRTGRVGTFASRSPYRPNPLAMSNVKLIQVRGRHLYIGSHDLLDETPILDIKPYIPEFDSFPEESAGWYDQMAAQLGEPKFTLEFSEQAESFLADDPSLREQIAGTLSRDPYPHRTRRIVEYEDGYRMSLGDWRCFFRVESEVVRVLRVVERECVEDNPGDPH